MSQVSFMGHEKVIYERFKRTNSAPLVTIYTLQDKTVCVAFFMYLFFIFIFLFNYKRS